jgi:hypothetical protein
MNNPIYHIATIHIILILCISERVHASETTNDENFTKTTIQHWSDIATQDIKQAHEILIETHPAKLDISNIEFNSWLHYGYKQSLLLAGRSESEEQALAALNHYLTGFMDEHLVAERIMHKPITPHWTGWTIDYKNGRYYVASRSAEWPINLPRINDEIISCDGVGVQEILRDKVAPFVDRRIYLENTLSKLSKYITVEHIHKPLWKPLRLTHCVFQNRDGTHQKISLHWEKQPEGLKMGRQSAPQQGMNQIKKGVYWIHASNFILNSEESKRFDNLLNQIRSLDVADAIVLDTRGNNGGNSMVGFRLLSTILKGKTSSHQNAKAFWRVSPLARKALDSHRSSALQIEGEESSNYKWLDSLIKSMDSAALRGDTFVEQLSTPTREKREIKQDKQSFQGKLILITDSYCNSACLDFVDEVMSLPGVLHVGSTTNADTRYMDVGMAALPSGAKLWIPLKVWIGRRRQDNVPYVPQITYHQDINDTEALQAWVLQSILPIAKNIGTP